MAVLAFDLGASSGRGMIGTLVDGEIQMVEVHRFENQPVKMGGYLQWDILRLWHEFQVTISKALRLNVEIESIGIDSWGVDYGLIDEEGELLRNPIHYRDARAQKGLERLAKDTDLEEVKRLTGMDCVSYNTVNQLLAETLLNNKTQDEGQACPYKLLNIPDLFNFMLTGMTWSEFSMASTTQLLDYQTLDWHHDWIDHLGIPTLIFLPIIKTGEIYGFIKKEVAEGLGLKEIPVISVASHDTAAAVSSIHSGTEECLFIATGTWIIVGAKQRTMTMNEAVIRHGLSNEGGAYPTVNLLKNHVGLWLLQECRRHWLANGEEISFGDMVNLGEKSQIVSRIDIEDPRFFEPGDMPMKIKKFCEETHQILPESLGDYVCIIEHSLASQIALTISAIEESIEKTFSEVYLIGGGVADQFLCRLVEVYTKKKVILGSKEATAFGNIQQQFISLGQLKDFNTGGLSC